MSDVDRPSEMPRWATDNVDDPATGSANVLEPPDSKKNVGWNAFEPPARQFFNWLGRKTYEWINYLDDRVAGRNITGEGQVVFNKEDVLLVLYAVNITDATEYVHATGFRADGSPVLNTISNNVLTIGSISSDGTVEVDGGDAENIIVYGIMQK